MIPPGVACFGADGLLRHGWDGGVVQRGYPNPKLTQQRRGLINMLGGSDDWTVDGMSFALVMPDDLPVTTPIASVVGFLFAMSMMVLVPAMVTMGLGRRTHPESAE